MTQSYDTPHLFTVWMRDGRRLEIEGHHSVADAVIAAGESMADVESWHIIGRGLRTEVGRPTCAKSEIGR